ncbi:uncharacterized protein LOC105693205 [Athalia rosae]|uniref:uncharacterized protein LOC105693205 n=1 Tax=Athalia rosae TaxID=37344 RepID=UPI002034216A|nr:uncharacterized protein LOC105693205 [Athalia rosae]
MEDRKMQQWTSGDYTPLVSSPLGSTYTSDVKITRSGPDTRLSELEQQLEVAESRCGSLKSQLDYMKMLYQGVQPCSTHSIQTAHEPPQTMLKNMIRQSPRQEQQPLHQPKNIAEQQQNQPKNVAKQLSRERIEPITENKENRDDNSAADEDIKYYQFLHEIQKLQEITKGDADHEKLSPKQSPKSQRVSPRHVEPYCTALNENESISAEHRHIKQIRRTHNMLSAAAKTTQESLSTHKSLTTAVTSLEIPDVSKEHDIDDATASQRPYDHSDDYSVFLQNDLAIARNLTRQSIAANKSESVKNGVIQEKRETKKHELVLKLSESIDSTPTIRRKKIVKVDRKQKSVPYTGPVVKRALNTKYDDTLSVTSKTKRKKAKLRNANSRNTVTTKEINLTDRKYSKKQKQKGYSSATHVSHQPPTPIQRMPRTRAEVVEIYHNNAVEGGSGSISMSSSKHEAQPQNNDAAFKVDSGGQISSRKTYQQQQQVTEQQVHISGQKVLQEGNDGRISAQDNTAGVQKYSSRGQRSQSYEIEDCNAASAQCRSAEPLRYFDPTITRNYELPTVASKLKKVNRSYFNRFNFRNIPFVVSTSVSPSHNLGLNIQQVLSIMKTRQPMTTGITPLLIRKMSKGIKPVSTLLDRASYSPKSPKCSILETQNDNWDAVKSNYSGSMTMQTQTLNGVPKMQTSCNVTLGPNNSKKLNSQHPLIEEEESGTSGERNWPQQRVIGSGSCPNEVKSYNKMLKQYTSRKSLTGDPTLTASALLRERQEEINIGDNQFSQIENGTRSAKGIRDVLINLHDQFEELNKAYEKLQGQMAKANDKSLAKQAAALEKELNAKEDEINAVVGLYKEVLYLKQQVNSIHSKNSIVCITTIEKPSSPGMMPQVIRNQMGNPMQIFRMRGKSMNTREPATSTRLAGLLREIQSFQKQLLSL